MMPVLHKITQKCMTVLMVAGFSVTLGGCGGIDGVDINLPVVGNIMAKSKRTEQDLPDRGKLLLPPKSAMSVLPDPNQAQARVSAQQQWPDDPDLRAKKMAALKKKKIEHERRHGNFKSYSGQEGFDRATDSYERQEGVLNKYYRKSKEK